MGKQIKREVKENAYRRLPQSQLQSEPRSQSPPARNEDDSREPCPEAMIAYTKIGGSDTILLMFYLEHLLPLLFPFYRPSLLQGGRAWIMELMIRSPALRQTTLCQSLYFFSLLQGEAHAQVASETVLKQTGSAFVVLGHALQVINGTSITEHLNGSVRIFTTIIQLQRCEIAVSSFKNCQMHLNAALALFKQILEISKEPAGPQWAASSFNSVFNILGPSSWVLPAQGTQVPSAEQAAFCFSSTLLIFDDIIASTVLQRPPTLYEYHSNLIGGTEPPINLEAVIGCQNWVLLQIGEISALDSWKQECKRAGNLNPIHLFNRATAIKESLETDLVALEHNPVIGSQEESSFLDVFTSDKTANETCSVTRVWAHAALLYLSVVVSGRQPSDCDVRYHVGQINDLISQISPPALLRIMVWPFLVAGCLAEPSQEPLFRGMVEALQPPDVYGTVHKALEIMEDLWKNRVSDASQDFSAFFRNQDSLVLLI